MRNARLMRALSKEEGVKSLRNREEKRGKVPPGSIVLLNKKSEKSKLSLFNKMKYSECEIMYI